MVAPPPTRQRWSDVIEAGAAVAELVTAEPPKATIKCIPVE